MAKIYLLVAPACNDIFIPVTAFHTLEQGLKHLNSLFPELAVKEVKGENGKREWRVRWSEKLASKYAMRLFTSYYGGCGECNGITLLEIDEGECSFSFNLD